jgi:hypothetical protein
VPDVLRAILAVATAIGETGIAKGRRNQQQGYSFRGIDEMYNALNPLMSAESLIILPRMLKRKQEERATRGGGALFYVTVTAEFDFTSCIDASVRTVRTYGEAMDTADKATNKAMSAAYKYAVMQTFAIPTEGDNDADATTHEPLAKGAKPAPDGRLTRVREDAIVAAADKAIALFVPGQEPFAAQAVAAIKGEVENRFLMDYLVNHPALCAYITRHAAQHQPQGETS